MAYHIEQQPEPRTISKPQSQNEKPPTRRPHLVQEGNGARRISGWLSDDYVPEHHHGAFADWLSYNGIG